MPRSDTMSDLSRHLRSGETTSRDLIEQALQAIRDPDGEGGRTFLKVDAEGARLEADSADARLRSGTSDGPLVGIPVSIKDLFDLAGEPTPAGSVVLRGAPPAARDSAAVARLKMAGMIVIGRTNMTEFAYSGLGLNPHYGTPRNPFERSVGRVPGGSSSGAAVSVTDGMAAAALGTDTGGSVRLPAALSGICGFKPTSGRIPTEGVLPLSPSLDTVGPLANTVADCALLDAALSGLELRPIEPFPLPGLRFGIPLGYLADDLDPTVGQAFERALKALSAAGVGLVEFPFDELLEVPRFYKGGGFLAAEAYAWHRPLLNRHSDDYDPRVSARILAGAQLSAADYIELLNDRRDLMERCREVTRRFDALIFPTCPVVAPRLADLEQDEDYYRTNLRVLRNTAVANLLDRCALSVPCHRAGEAPVGLSVMGESGDDRRLLSIGRAIEAALQS